MYATKCLKKRLVFLDLTQKIYEMRELERNIARKYSRMFAFNVTGKCNGINLAIISKEQSIL